MARNFNVSGDRRKELAKKVAEFTGEKEKYLGLPTYSYQSGPFNISKTGLLTWMPDADEKAKKLFFWLQIAGFTGVDVDDEVSEAQPAEAEDPDADETTVTNEEAATEQPAEDADTDTDAEDNNTSAGNDADDLLADASAETEMQETENAVEADVKEEADNEADAEAEPDNTVSDSIQAGDSGDDADDGAEELHADATAGSDRLSVSIPDDLTDEQRENLRKIVRSKETLLKHAFRTDSVEIHMEDGKLVFPWFSASDGDHTNAYILFLTMLIKFAKEAKRVTGADHPVENEKYAMRTWLLRLDMIGPEYKGCRKVLLENLTGSCAFRDGHKKGGGEKNAAEKEAV